MLAEEIVWKYWMHFNLLYFSFHCFSLIGLEKSITRGGRMEMTFKEQMFHIYDWNSERRYINLPHITFSNVLSIKIARLYTSHHG